MNRYQENKMVAYAMAAVFIIILLLIALTGCRPVQYIKGETITKEIRVVERDTLIRTEADSASINALLHCDSAYNVVLGDLEMSEGERINLEWKIGLIMGMNGRTMAAINVKAREDEQTNNVTIRDTETSQAIERNIIEYRNTDWATFCIRYFWGTMVALLLCIGAWAFRKFYLRK